MTKRIVTFPASTDEIGDSLFFNPSLFGKLGALNGTNPRAVSVMLMLVADIDDDGGVQVSQEAVAHQCGITLQQVESAVADLERAGLISTSKGTAGFLTCVVNRDLARAEKPDELGSLSVAG